MSNAKHDSKSNSGEASSIRRNLLPLEKSERGYLCDQATAAKSAIARTMHEIKNNLSRAADLRSHMKRHPWLVTGSAVVVGLVAGTALTSYLRKKTKHTESNSAEMLPSGNKGKNVARPKKSILGSIVGTILVGMLKAFVQGSLTVAEKPAVHQKVNRRHRPAAGKRSGTVASDEHADS